MESTGSDLGAQLQVCVGDGGRRTRACLEEPPLQILSGTCDRIAALPPIPTAGPRVRGAAEELPGPIKSMEPAGSVEDPPAEPGISARPLTVSIDKLCIAGGLKEPLGLHRVSGLLIGAEP